MKRFKKSESAYTATAMTVTMSGSTTYDPAVLDNPVRKKINAALTIANERSYKEYRAL